MFESYDTKSFGVYIRNVRISLGLTQKDVSRLTRINSETLRKMENGMTIPKFETLEYLSVAYKQDVLAVFTFFRKDQELYGLYKDLDYIIVSNELERLNDFQDNLKAIENGNEKIVLFNNNEIDQLKLITEGIKFLNLGSNHYQDALDILNQAIHKTLKGFKVDRFEYFKYNQIEKRILLLLAVTYAELGEYEFSNELLIFLMNISNGNQFMSQTDLFMYIKIIFNISYNYHELDQFENSLEYATKGIELCLKNETTYLLSGLLFRRAVSKKNLRCPDSESDFKKSIELLNVMEHEVLKKIYIDKAAELYGYTNNPI
ncbi:helix-turn-helix domain-containing protein [Fusibacter ferrireducens]|uniref:Helix-turn-helix transcriptional regulator n=1 Tax=Fusibacter ferrireducens TaxID=2785058 RepID=A0ABR9ZRM1_9FIRM|nr:helix-turn-helix domain-containing protein [Fusibacter ferrireducens]MBF4693103.1 helix-turn-helix transcriptional regulator [Fusibacter ferrireducens]